jgi:DNA-binding NarL/FixJ family response regulator
MPIMNGFEAARAILSSGSAARVVFINAVADSDYVRAALSLGASGYVVKSRAALDLTHAIRLAMLGQSSVSPSEVGPWCSGYKPRHDARPWAGGSPVNQP